MTGLQNSRNPALGDYDLREFARALIEKRRVDPRGLSVISGEIGVTISDMSRAMGGQGVSVAKVIALCRWLGVAVDRFYLEPDPDLKSMICSGGNVKHSAPDPARPGQIDEIDLRGGGLTATPPEGGLRMERMT